MSAGTQEQLLSDTHSIASSVSSPGSPRGDKSHEYLEVRPVSYGSDCSDRSLTTSTPITPRTRSMSPGQGNSPSSPTTPRLNNSQRTPLLSPAKPEGDSLVRWIEEDSRKDPEYYKVIQEVENAIDGGVHPKLIVQGSSGSYFAKNPEQKIVGVFKPKDEEPYGPANPKWGKFFQRKLCPCMFGRDCIKPNQGYLSEAAASILDSALGLDIVPKTKVVQLASKSFYYTKAAKVKTSISKRVSEQFPQSVGKRIRQGLPPKTGSFQLFVSGFRDANQVFKQLDFASLPKEVMDDFQHKFEKLVCLDFMIRNTDRGMDNWLIKYEDSKEEPNFLEIAAIDNGLAFPHKHPDNWRAYPYQWAYLTIAKRKFSEQTKQKLLPFLSDNDKVENLVNEIEAIHKTDPAFKRSVFEKQMSVMRGQIVVLREALRTSKSPMELVAMPSITVHKQKKMSYRQKVVNKLPFFRNW
eukprot:m.339528 g.339528  ORF g.339528 m.339528 type:complete len:465 (+) comp18848_c0_seq1:155-1549(+)